MLQFEKLYQKLDQTTKTTEKVEALVEFFHLCTDEDKIWIIALFTGRRPKRSIPLANLRKWAAEFAEIPQWLFDESYHTVGDLAETISLVLGRKSQNISPNLPLDYWLQHLYQLKNQSEENQRETIFQFWNELSTEGRFLLNKLITGGFRIGVSQALLTQALSKYTGIPKDDLTFRISGKWDLFKTNFDQLILNSDLSYSDSKPYPFFLAYPIPEDVLSMEVDPTNINQNPLHTIQNWQFEYKWDGIRGQLILRNDTVTLWSRGEEIISSAFPEIIESISSFRGMLNSAKFKLSVHNINSEMSGESAIIDSTQFIQIPPNSNSGESELQVLKEIRLESVSPESTNSISSIVLDGEIIAWNFQANEPLPFSDLQRRIGRKTVSKKLREEIPCAFLVYDIMELNHNDIRELPLSSRRNLIESLFSNHLYSETDQNSKHIILPPLLHPPTWLQAQEIRNAAKSQKAEGLMVKLKSSSYGVGRKRGDWWKWKVEAETIDAVLIYAQRGHGKRANLYTDFTFALKNGDLLTPFAKAYSGLSNSEIEELNKWIKSHTRESFGPVRSVEPVHVFEIGFEAIQKSKRHKSGVAVRFPRIIRWRKDKSVNDIGHLQDLLDQAL